MRYPTFVYTAIILIAICLYFLRVRQSYITEYFTNMNGDQRPLRVFMHGFWDNPKPFVFKFFKEICQVAFNRQCEYGNENDSDIIVQSVFTNDKDILKKFKYKIFYSAENWKFDPNFYDVLLTYEHTNGKNIRCPYFLVEKSAEEFAQCKIKRNISRRIREILGQEKSETCMSYTGCSLDKLKNHIESSMLDGMIWQNYGTSVSGKYKYCWHIDHIIPVNAFNWNNIVEQKACSHYSNLRAFWWDDNIIKHDTFDPDAKSRYMRWFIET